MYAREQRQSKEEQKQQDEAMRLYFQIERNEVKYNVRVQESRKSDKSRLQVKVSNCMDKKDSDYILIMKPEMPIEEF